MRMDYLEEGSNSDIDEYLMKEIHRVKQEKKLAVY